MRRDAGIWALQTVLHRKGFGPVAGVDEAGRGACAGPLVVAACVLRPADQTALDGLTDSKLLTAARREHYHDLIITRSVARSVVVIPPDEVDELGVHVANLEGMRRAVAGLAVHPGYVLTDGFRVPGLTAPNMAVIGGDRAAACVAAASVLALSIFFCSSWRRGLLACAPALISAQALMKDKRLLGESASACCSFSNASLAWPLRKISRPSFIRSLERICRTSVSSRHPRRRP